MQSWEFKGYAYDFVKDTLQNYKNSNVRPFCYKNTLTNHFQNPYGALNSTFQGIEFRICHPSNSTCKRDFTQINEPLYIHAAFPKFILNPQNYSNPVSIMFDSEVFYYDKYFKRFCYLIFTNDVVVTDKGWLFESLEEKNYISFYRAKNDILIKGEDNSIFSLMLNSPYKKKITTRKYMKIQDLLGNIGGFIDCLFFLFHLVIGGYVDFKYNVNTYNNIISKINISKEKFKLNSANNLLNNNNQLNNILQNSLEIGNRRNKTNLEINIEDNKTNNYCDNLQEKKEVNNKKLPRDESNTELNTIRKDLIYEAENYKKSNSIRNNQSIEKELKSININKKSDKLNGDFLHYFYNGVVQNTIENMKVKKEKSFNVNNNDFSIKSLNNFQSNLMNSNTTQIKNSKYIFGNYFEFLIDRYFKLSEKYKIQFLMVNGITSFQYYINNTMEKNINDYVSCLEK